MCSCSECDGSASRTRKCTLLNGVGDLDPINCEGAAMENTDGVGWTVIQRRGDFGRPDDYFLRNWTEYRNGFGDPEEDFWLGLEAIHRLGLGREQQLLIELEDFDGGKASVIIDDFQVGDEASDYTLTHSGFSNDYGNSFPPSGTKFTTIDRDNDIWDGHAGNGGPDGNCAKVFSGAWWYTGCHASNINGLYLRGSHASYANGVNWLSFRGYQYSLKNTVMKVRATP